MPESIVEVRVLVVENILKLGPESLFPATMETAVASPKARLRPKMSPEKIPDLAAGMMTLKFVSLLDAPSAKKPFSKLLLTAFKEVIESMVTVGTDIIVKTKTTEKVERPPADW